MKNNRSVEVGLNESLRSEEEVGGRIETFSEGARFFRITAEDGEAVKRFWMTSKEYEEATRDWYASKNQSTFESSLRDRFALSEGFQVNLEKTHILDVPAGGQISAVVRPVRSISNDWPSGRTLPGGGEEVVFETSELPKLQKWQIQGQVRSFQEESKMTENEVKKAYESADLRAEYHATYLKKHELGSDRNNAIVTEKDACPQIDRDYSIIPDRDRSGTRSINIH